jgi:hypothetical protein
MNIGYTESVLNIIAKTCGCREKENSKKVTYSFVDNYHYLCIDKRDVILEELEACERLLKYAVDEIDKKTIETEIAQLKMILDLMS